MRALRGKTTLVTGAASGIGRAVALRFRAEGARVVIADHDTGAAGELKSRMGDKARAITVDVADEASVEATFQALERERWAPDVVVANAGVQLFGKDSRIADLDIATWQQTLKVNLTGTFLTVKHAVRAMTGRGGSIILTGSPTGLTGEGQDFTAYSASKAGIHGLTRTVAAGYADQGIRVNTVVPGYTETSLVADITEDPSSRTATVDRIPLRRAGTPRDVEGIMVYLASDDSTFATGALFTVDGGMSTL